MLKKGLLLLFMVGTVGLWQLAAQKWQATSHDIQFFIRNAGIKVSGTLDGLEANITFNPNQPAGSSLQGSVEVSTIDTGIGARDRHLKKEDYFFIDQFPRINMRSKSIRRTSSAYEGVFVVEIKGTRQEVTLPFTFAQQGNTGTFKGTFSIDRRDFEVGGYSLILADTVKVELEVTVRRLDN